MVEITDRTQTESGEAHSSSSHAGSAREVVGSTVDIVSIVSRDWHGTDGVFDDDLSPDTHKTRPKARTLTQP